MGTTFSRDNKPGPKNSKFKMTIYFPHNRQKPETWYSFPKYDKEGAKAQFDRMKRTLIENRHHGDVTSSFFRDIQTDEVIVKMYGGEIVESKL
ncbi:MAG: hypothetical protein PF448_06275 [Bacteroidales bacterium]|jgi:hypothetical protein|nr:hypothetical protein [Bacteroidales bacterium]